MATDVTVLVQDASNSVVLEDTSVVSVSLTDEQLVVVEDQITHIVSVGEQGPVGATGATGPGVSLLSLEAGETLIVGDPVWVSANKLYKADNVTSYKIVGVVTTAALAGLLATATTAGLVTLSGLSVGSPYFLGNGIITASAPTSGYIVRVGQAISGTSLLLNIEEPVLLAA